MADEFPGYYVINGKKVTPHGEPYKKGKEDEPEAADALQLELEDLRAQLAAAKAERDAAPKPADPPKPARPTAPGTTPPAN